jgi:hypothetical protein
MTSLFDELISNRRLLIILAVASFLRIYGLNAFSLSNDELSALSRLQFDSFTDVINQGVIPDFHPAGVQVFLYAWTAIFGFDDWIVRLPFALMGVVSVYMIYLLGRFWFGEGTALLAAAALAVLEYPLLYSQIARPYSPGLMVSLFAAYYWSQSLFVEHKDNQSRWINYLTFALFVSACMYTHYFSFIFAGILCFTGLFFVRKSNLIPYLFAGVIIVLLYIPHVGIFLEQLSRGGIGGPDGWLSPPKNDAFSKYVDYAFNNSSSLKLLFFIIFTGTFLLFRRELKFSRFHVLAILFFIVPFLIAYFYSHYVNPVFQYSVLLFSFPYLLLFLFSMIPSAAGKGTVSFLLFVILAGGFYSTVAEKNYYTTEHFTEFRKLVLRTIELNLKLGKDNITRTTNVFSPYYINYYHEKYNAPCDYAVTRILGIDEKKRFYRVVEQSKTNWFLYSYSNITDPPEYDLVIRSKYPYLALNDSMMGSGLRLYSRSPIDSAINILPVKVLTNGFESGLWAGEQSFIDSATAYVGRFSAMIDKEMEYGPTFESQLFQIAAVAGSRIEISAAFTAPESLVGVKLVVSIEEAGKSIIWQGQDIGQFMINGNDWFRAFTVVSLPQNITGKENIKIYCWNEKKESFRIDDIIISVYSR